MIRTTIPPQSANYIADILTPGTAFLRRTSRPSNREWGLHSYWRLAHNDLYAAYSGVCNYCSSWSPRTQASSDNHSTIDHYIPKSAAPLDAYKWNNFRLCRRRLNTRKDAHRDVLDPSKIKDTWFWLDFTTFLIGPSPTAHPNTHADIASTIARLELNDDMDYINERRDIIGLYSVGEISQADVASKYPFISQQMVVQKFDTAFKASLAAYFIKLRKRGSWRR